MKTCRSTLRTMRLVILVCQLGLILRTDAQIPQACADSSTNRSPVNSDIKVVCGPKYMDLDIYLCPMYQALYNESLMVLNGQVNNPECYGTADWNGSTPLLKFQFPINATSGKSFCDNTNEITSERGEGVFADFSNVQYVNISGTVVSIDPTAGTITYRRQIMYKFSCKYPMQYLLNNTEVAVSGASLAIRDNNGSFISTLSMALYKDDNYKDLLIVPDGGLSLKTKIYVAVHATNLTENFHVLLDRCFATTKPHPFNSTHHDLFVGCTFDGQTKVEMNGKGHKAYFSFEAFRFVEHKNLTISTFYVHCAVRLCKDEDCERLSNCTKSQTQSQNLRRKRGIEDVPTNGTITSPVIRVGTEENGDAQTFAASPGPGHNYPAYHGPDHNNSAYNGGSYNHFASRGTSPQSSYSSPVIVTIICLVITVI